MIKQLWTQTPFQFPKYISVYYCFPHEITDIRVVEKCKRGRKMSSLSGCLVYNGRTQNISGIQRAHLSAPKQFYTEVLRHLWESTMKKIAGEMVHPE